MKALYVLIGLVVVIGIIFVLWLIGYICLHLIGGKDWANSDTFYTVFAGIIGVSILSALIGIAYMLGMNIMVILGYKI